MHLYRVFVILLVIVMLSSGCGDRESEADDNQQFMERLPTQHQELQNLQIRENQHIGQMGQNHKDETLRLNEYNQYNEQKELQPPIGKSTQQDIIKKQHPSQKNKVKVKGIYVTGWVAAGKRMNDLVALLDRTDLNAMVIDIKTDSGQITYDSNVALVNEIGADSNAMIKNIKQLLSQLKRKHIYTIARLVTFKDPYLARRKPQLAMHAKSGAVWTDRKGVPWVDPYNRDVWSYNRDIAKEAASLGFDEIQFDYIRFPDNGKRVNREVNFDNPNNWPKSKAVTTFLDEAQTELDKLGVSISADVFGMTTTLSDDMGIGQVWSELVQKVDYISPMVYPSHYSSGIYGVAQPDLHPYEIVKRALTDAKAKNAAIAQGNNRAAVIRPWLQDFSAVWLQPHQTYRYEQVSSQIRAAREQGVDQFLLWNAQCKYSYQ